MWFKLFLSWKRKRPVELVFYGRTQMCPYISEQPIWSWKQTCWQSDSIRGHLLSKGKCNPWLGQTISQYPVQQACQILECTHICTSMSVAAECWHTLVDLISIVRSVGIGFFLHLMSKWNNSRMPAPDRGTGSDSNILVVLDGRGHENCLQMLRSFLMIQSRFPSFYR